MKIPFVHSKQIDEHPILIKHDHRNFGQRASDKLTEKMGSWNFILLFFVFLFLWMVVNVIGWWQNWDPYPFILLNLILSCLAAIQAPIIMMSQNRQTERDRLTAKYDYAVNRKAEKEIQDIQKDLEDIKKLIRKLNKKKID